MSNWDLCRSMTVTMQCGEEQASLRIIYLSSSTIDLGVFHLFHEAVLFARPPSSRSQDGDKLSDFSRGSTRCV
jgi:hypothetical protein